LRKNKFDVVMKMKFSINFPRVGQGYGGLEKFIIIDQFVGFPGEHSFSFADVKFRIVSIPPTLCRVNVRL
jgi:hypothetical protein